MSDIDYRKLFENGQLIHQEPHHKELLDRFWQASRGYPEESIFLSKYRSYLEEYHPEVLNPVSDNPDTEPSPPSPEPQVTPEPEVVSEEKESEVVGEVIDVDPVEPPKKRGRPKKSSPPA